MVLGDKPNIMTTIKERIKKIKADKKSHDLYDDILKRLPKDSTFIELDLEVADVGFLHGENLITFETISYAHGRYKVKLTSYGHSFLGKGGFTKQDQDELFELMEMKRSNCRSNFAIYISIAAIIVSIAAIVKDFI